MQSPTIVGVYKVMEEARCMGSQYSYQVTSDEHVGYEWANTDQSLTAYNEGIVPLLVSLHGK